MHFFPVKLTSQFLGYRWWKVVFFFFFLVKQVNGIKKKVYIIIYHKLKLFCDSCPVVSNSLRPIGCSPLGSSVHGDSPGKNTGVGCYALLQGIFPSQGLNPGLPHCRWILYHLNHQGCPWILKGVAYPFTGSSQPKNWTGVSFIAGEFFYQLSYQWSWNWS